MANKFTKEQLDAIENAKKAFERLDNLEVLTMYDPDVGEVVAIDSRWFKEIRVELFENQINDDEVEVEDLLEDNISIASMGQCPDSDDFVFVKLK